MHNLNPKFVNLDITAIWDWQFFAVGAVLSTVGCLPAFLAHSMPETSPPLPSPALLQPKMSLDILPGVPCEARSPLIENYCLSLTISKYWADSN